MSSSYQRDAQDMASPLTASAVDEPALAHPVGTGVGAVLGAAGAGAVAGGLAGPLGSLAGALAGAVAGGLMGKAVAEVVDPSCEDLYWREHHVHRPYVPAGAPYADYGPAYAYGVSAYSQYAGRDFDAVEPELAQGWAVARGSSQLDWDSARLATRDAWDRLGVTLRGVA